MPSDLSTEPKVKSKERIEWEEVVKAYYGSKEHRRMVREMARDYAKYGIKFEHPLLDKGRENNTKK